MPDAREKQIQYADVGTPATIPDFGIAGAASLSDKLQRFGYQAQRIGNKMAQDDIASEDARLTADAHNTINRLAVENELDPERFRKSANEAVAGMLHGAHRQTAADLKPWADGKIGDAYLQLVQGAAAREDDRKLGDYNKAMNALDDDAEWRAQNGQDLADNHARALKLADDLTGRRDAEGNATTRPLADDSKVAGWLHDRDQKIAVARAWGQYQRAPSPGAFAAELTPEKAQAMGVPAEEYRRLQDRIEGDIRSQNAEARANEGAARARAAEARSDNEARAWSSFMAERNGMTDKDGNPVKGPTAADIIRGVNVRAIDRDFGDQMLKAITTGADVNLEPKDEDKALVFQLRRDADNGIDPGAAVRENHNKRISDASAKDIMDRYQGVVDKKVQRYERQVRAVYTVTGIGQQKGPNEEATINAAVEEYHSRVKEGEDPAEVAKDMQKGRYDRYVGTIAEQQSLSDLTILPRALRQTGIVKTPEGVPDRPTNRRALDDQLSAGRITFDEYWQALDFIDGIAVQAEEALKYRQQNSGQ